MIAKDILLSKTDLVSGTASDVMKSIRAGIIYNGETRYVHTGHLAGVTNVMAEFDEMELSGSIEMSDIDAEVSSEILSADITPSDKG